MMIQALANDEAEALANDEAEALANDEAEALANDETEALANDEIKALANDEIKALANDEDVDRKLSLLTRLGSRPCITWTLVHPNIHLVYRDTYESILTHRRKT
jgi:hypothetical protein